jgi:hypothetical protein
VTRDRRVFSPAQAFCARLGPTTRRKTLVLPRELKAPTDAINDGINECAAASAR